MIPSIRNSNGLPLVTHFYLAYKALNTAPTDIFPVSSEWLENYIEPHFSDFNIQRVDWGHLDYNSYLISAELKSHCLLPSLSQLANSVRAVKSSISQAT